jgi:type III pantothenate kinase
LAALLSADNSRAVIACVVPSVRQSLEAAFPDRLTFVSPDLDLGVDVSAIDTATIGADRLANAVGAVHECSLPVLIIDFGTAISSVLIDADRRLRGGFILPGRLLQRQALAERTGQLPFVELGPLPAAPVGCDTEAAMRAGLEYGVLGAVERLISECEQTLPGVTVHAVGGDTDFFCAESDRLSALDRGFTLRGVGYIAERLLY